MREGEIRLGSGRTLTYSDMGDPAGTCILNFHGAPSCRLFGGFLEDRYTALGLRVVSPDRPGFGGSTPQPRRSLADWPRDTAELADALGIDRFVVTGLSSGGPYAVACAALLAERIIGAVVVAGVTDMSWEHARDDYPQMELDIIDQPSEEAAVTHCAQRFGEDGSGLASAPVELPEPDVALLTTIPDEVYATMTESLRQGIAGFAQDVWVVGRPWPFDPAHATVPVEVVHGEEDDLVPLAHSRHTAGILPDATLRTVPGHGHLSIMSDVPDLAADLIRTAA